MGQCNVQRWTDELLEIVSQDEDVLGVEDLATHRVGLDQAPGDVRDLPAARTTAA